MIDPTDLILVCVLPRPRDLEIARLLGRKEDAVRKSIHRILERLSSQIEVQNV